MTHGIKITFDTYTKLENEIMKQLPNVFIYNGEDLFLGKADHVELEVSTLAELKLLKDIVKGKDN